MFLAAYTHRLISLSRYSNSEDAGNMFFQNSGVYLQCYISSAQKSTVISITAIDHWQSIISDSFKDLRYNEVKKKVKEKSKAVLITGREMLRIPHCLDNRLTDGSASCALSPGILSGTHFC
jgi:hypothetical protein